MNESEWRELRESAELLLAHGYGELTVTVREHKIDQIETLIRKKRKAAHVGPALKQA